MHDRPGKGLRPGAARVCVKPCRAEPLPRSCKRCRACACALLTKTASFALLVPADLCGSNQSLCLDSSDEQPLLCYIALLQDSSVKARHRLNSDGV